MKKLLSVTLAIVLVLSLAACGSGGVSAPASSAASTPAASTAAPAVESKWPSGVVNMYVPATAGGATDMMVRVLAQAATSATGGTFVVVNDMTGGGIVATETARNASIDGTELLFGNVGLMGKIASGQYDKTLDDFTILGLYSTQGQEGGGVFVKADSPFKTLDDLVKYAKENPGKIISGIQNGSSSHFMQALFEKEVGIETTMVDAGANADRITSMIGGNIDITIFANQGISQYVESGDLRCLVQLAEPSLVFTDVKTLKDYGYNSASIDNCGIILGPKGMREEDIAKISAVLKTCSEDPALKEGYAKLGVEWEPLNAAETKEYLATIQAQFTEAYKVLQERGLA